MLAQLQQTFPKIHEEIISEAFEKFAQNVEETKNQQQHLMKLFKVFGNKIEKMTILQTWRNFNQIYVDTQGKLEEICATSNLNELNVNKM
ncbi:hypothetical protein RFI_20798 [Reticulomyxa filosa]|uniref:Uncharacterized protein n=1 Tax=Reticulomyxa filosa TaxID=46433 RepID=X6MS91_RETFI|nr:hypothetical protein RFI_20798 [Reticulomyxa filosa]|eukprot:ETO16541.1 hypothetical protein RFI_20798 [Reticulomyxa filosa]